MTDFTLCAKKGITACKSIKNTPNTKVYGQNVPC